MAFSLLRRFFRSIRKKSKRNQPQLQQQKQQLQQQQQSSLMASLPSPDILDFVAANENDPIIIADAKVVRFVSPSTGCRTIIISYHCPPPAEQGASSSSVSCSRGTLTTASSPISNSSSVSLELPSFLRAPQPPSGLPPMSRLRPPNYPPIRWTAAGPASRPGPIVPYALRAVRTQPSMQPQPQHPRPAGQDRLLLVDLRDFRNPARSSTVPSAQPVPAEMHIRSQNSWDRRSSASSMFQSRMLLNSSTGNRNGGSSSSVSDSARATGNSSGRSGPLLPVLAAAPTAPMTPHVQQQQQQRQRRVLRTAPVRASWDPSPPRSGRPHSVPTMRTMPAASATTSHRVSTTFDEILASIDSPRTPVGRTAEETTAVPMLPTPAVDRLSQLLPSPVPAPSLPSSSTPATDMAAAPYELSAVPAPVPVPALPLWLSASASTRAYRRIAFNSREGHGLLLSLRRLLALPADGMTGAETLLFVLRHARVRQLTPPGGWFPGSGTGGDGESSSSDTPHDSPARLVARCNRISWYGLLQAMMHGSGPPQPDRYHQQSHHAEHPLARLSATDCALMAGWIASGEPLFTSQTAPTDLLLRQHGSQRLLSLSSASSLSSSAAAARRARRQLAATASSPEGSSRRLRRHHMWTGHHPSPLSMFMLSDSELL